MQVLLNKFVQLAEDALLLAAALEVFAVGKYFLMHGQGQDMVWGLANVNLQDGYLGLYICRSLWGFLQSMDYFRQVCWWKVGSRIGDLTCWILCQFPTTL